MHNNCHLGYHGVGTRGVVTEENWWDRHPPPPMESETFPRHPGLDWWFCFEYLAERE